jgi:transcriptional accessory protein Tex/SPT6
LTWSHPDGFPLEDLQEGDVIAGVVVNVVPLGVFVDIGAEVNALLACPRRFWKKFARGDHLEECVVDTLDLSRRRFTVLLEDPQAAISTNRTSLEDISIGMCLEGVVDHKNKFGTWVNVFAEVLGRLNVERSYAQRFLNGQVVRSIIIDRVDLDTGKLGLTLEDPEASLSEELVLVGIPPTEARRPGHGKAKAKAKGKAKPKATRTPVRDSHSESSTSRAYRQSPPPREQVRHAERSVPHTDGPQVGDWVNGVVISIASRGVMVDLGTEKLGTLVISSDLREQMQKSDQIQGMKVESITRSGMPILSLEDPTLENDEECADEAVQEVKPRRRPQRQSAKAAAVPPAVLPTRRATTVTSLSTSRHRGPGRSSW